MSYRIDTNILSELRKAKPNAAVRAWIRSTPTDQLFVSVITIGELENGADRVRKRDPAFAVPLDGWIAGLITDFAGNL